MAKIAIMAACVAVSTAGAARGQATPADEDRTAPLTTSDLKELTQLLELTPEQEQTVKALVEQAGAAIAKVYEERAKAVKPLLEDHAGEDWMKVSADLDRETTAMNEAVAAKVRSITRAELTDIKSTLTTAQAAHWLRVERYQRRQWIYSWYDLWFGDQSWSGFSLSFMLTKTKPDAADLAAVRPVLDEYEAAFDAAIVKAARAHDAYMAQLTDLKKAYAAGDLAAVWPQWEAHNAARTELAAVNRAFARTIEKALSEAAAKAFHERVYRTAYYGLYDRPARRPAALRIASAERLDDLDAQQAEALAAIKAGFERDMAAINTQAEKDIDTMMSDPDILIALDLGEYPSQPPRLEQFWRSYHARRSAREAEAIRAVDAMLSPAQVEKLPGLVPPRPKEQE